jgi:Tol biopolymer transport system component
MRATAEPPPIELPAPTSAPTWVAATFEPFVETPPPPTPDIPLGEALRRFDGNALLFTRPDRFLMLTDADGRQLWLTADEHFCGRSNTALSQSGAWSADGRYVAISCQDDGFDSKLLVELPTVNILDLETGKTRRVDVGSIEARGIRVDAGASSWSPIAPRLLLQTDRTTVMGTEEHPVYTRWVGWSIVDAPTGALEELIAFDPEGGSYSDAAWSPDGSRVAAIGRRAGEQRADVYLANTDGSGARQLKLNDVASFYGFSGAIAWSPDGRFLLLNRQLSPSPDVYTYQALGVEAKSGSATVLADNLTDVPDARWSPDGRWFLLKKYATADHTIVAWSLYSADGILVRTFSSDPTRSVENVAWMPDGRLAFAVNRVNFGAEVVLADVDGQEQVIARYPWAFAHQIAAAPDGSLFAVELDVPAQAQTEAGARQAIAILDLQGKTRAEVEGRIWGWRPQK